MSVGVLYIAYDGKQEPLSQSQWHRLRIAPASRYIAALMSLVGKSLTSARIVFDTRGFWAHVRVDGVEWPRQDRMYRLAKWFERWLLLGADHLVPLTLAQFLDLVVPDCRMKLASPASAANCP